MGKESGFRLVGGWSSSLLRRWWMVQEDLAGWRPERAGVQEDLAGGTLAAARFLPWSSGDGEALMPGRQPSRWLQELSDHAGAPVGHRPYDDRGSRPSPQPSL